MNSFTHEHPLMRKCMDVTSEHREVMQGLLNKLFPRNQKLRRTYAYTQSKLKISQKLQSNMYVSIQPINFQIYVWARKNVYM